MQKLLFTVYTFPFSKCVNRINFPLLMCGCSVSLSLCLVFGSYVSSVLWTDAILAACGPSPCPSVLIFRTSEGLLSSFTNQTKPLKGIWGLVHGLTHPQAPPEAGRWGLLSWNLLGTLQVGICQPCAGCEQGQGFFSQVTCKHCSCLSTHIINSLSCCAHGP